jgi:hypothetical protein
MGKKVKMYLGNREWGIGNGKNKNKTMGRGRGGILRFL